MVPDLPLRFALQFRRISHPLLRGEFPLLRGKRAGLGTRLTRGGPMAEPNRGIGDAKLGTRLPKAQSLNLHQVLDAVPGEAALAAVANAGDMVHGAGVPEIVLTVRPDDETVGLPRLPTAQRARAIEAVSLRLHCAAKAVPIVLKHGGHMILPTLQRRYFHFILIFLFFFSMGGWED